MRDGSKGDAAGKRGPHAGGGTEGEAPASARGGAASGGVASGGPVPAVGGVSAVVAGGGAVAGRASDVPGDTVAAVVRQWQAVRPDVDTGPMEVIGRINRCAALLQQAEDAPLRRVGLTRPEFDLLGALRRTGHELTPGELARETFSSGAAVTKRLKQLQERDLVDRRADTRDRRVSHVGLTDAGRDLVDSILPDQLAYETVVLAGIDEGGQAQLSSLLGELLGQLEGRLGPASGFRG